MKKYLLPAIVLFPVVTLVCWVYFGTNRLNTMSKNPAKKTVEDRLREYGPTARARLQPYFSGIQVPYPPARLVFVGLKNEKVLRVYAASAPNQTYRFLRFYPILAASGTLGPKLREGDQQVPEGVYAVESLNPNSAYHLALRINYPNQFDRDQARREGRANLGGDIMIHGGNVSVGCLAMGDEAAEDLFVMAADTGITNITVILSPADFQKGRTVFDTQNQPRWTGTLYQTITSNLNDILAEK